MYDLENPIVYDLIIIGAGPAGLTASIYASCFHLKHLVIGKILGGQMLLASDILNYPGFENISGKELTERMVAQVKKRGGEITVGSVAKIVRVRPSGNLRSDPNDGFELVTQEGKKYQTKAIILATGTERRKLNVPGEVEHTGRGVYYCATCERLDYAGKVCGVVGGANAAVQGVVQLAQAAAKVYIIYRGSELRGDPIWLSQVEKNPKISVIYNTIATEIIGDGEKVTGVRLRSNIPSARAQGEGKNQISNTQIKNEKDRDNISRGNLQITNHPIIQSSNHPIKANQPISNITTKQWNNEILSLDKLFIEIGGVPGTALVIPLGVEMDPRGYVKVNGIMATNVAGIFAAGDLVSYGLSIEQITSAIGLGARAAASVFAFLKKEKAPSLWGESQIRR